MPPLTLVVLEPAQAGPSGTRLRRRRFRTADLMFVPERRELLFLSNKGMF